MTITLLYLQLYTIVIRNAIILEGYQTSGKDPGLIKSMIFFDQENPFFRGLLFESKIFSLVFPADKATLKQKPSLSWKMTMVFKENKMNELDVEIIFDGIERFIDPLFVQAEAFCAVFAPGDQVAGGSQLLEMAGGC